MTGSFRLIAIVMVGSLVSCGGRDTTSTTTVENTVDSMAITVPTPNPVAGPEAGVTIGLTDQDFVTRATAMNVAELQAHRSARSHAVTDEVKAHAKHMLDDHRKMEEELKALASRKGLSVSTDPPIEKKQQLDDLNTRTGKDWDLGYLDAQIIDHNEAIALFESGSGSVKDSDLKALIDKSLPTLRAHLQMVKDAQALLTK